MFSINHITGFYVLVVFLSVTVTSLSSFPHTWGHLRCYRLISVTRHWAKGFEADISSKNKGFTVWMIKIKLIQPQGVRSLFHFKISYLEEWVFEGWTLVEGFNLIIPLWSENEEVSYALTRASWFHVNWLSILFFIGFWFFNYLSCNICWCVQF